MSGSLFHELWDMLGDVWAYFGNVFGWVWDGVEKRSEKYETTKVIRFVREYFSRVGLLETSIFSRSPDKNVRNFEN